MIGILITGLLALMALCLGLWVASRSSADILPPPPAAPERWLRPPAEPGPGTQRGFIGVLVAGDAVDIEPRVEGRIEQVLVKPGDQVRRGDLLARLEVESLRKELLSAEAALRDARRRLQRRLQNAVGGAFTEEELDSHKREALQAQARVDQLARSVSAGHLAAPHAGAVAERYLGPGAVTGPGRPVIRLVRRGEARVRFAIPEEQARTVRLGTSVAIQVQPGGPLLRGRVASLNPEVDSSSRMVYAVATLDNQTRQSADLATGLIVRVAPDANRLQRIGE